MTRTQEESHGARSQVSARVRRGLMLPFLILVLLGTAGTAWASRAESNSLATACPGKLCGQAGVGEHGSMVVEPVEIGGRRVEAQEVVPEPRPGRRERLEVGARPFQVVGRERPAAPAVPGEARRLPVGRPRIDVEDATVERRGLELGAMGPQERRAGLVPAELDELLRRVARVRARAAAVAP